MREWPSGISSSNTLSGRASPGSHHQLSSQAAASPPGREPGSATSASTAYAYARPPTVPQRAMIARTQEIGCSGLRVVSRSADQGENDVDSQVDERLVGARVQVERECGDEDGGRQSEDRPAQPHPPRRDGRRERRPPSPRPPSHRPLDLRHQASVDGFALPGQRRAAIRDADRDSIGTLPPGSGTQRARTVVTDRRTDADKPQEERT